MAVDTQQRHLGTSLGYGHMHPYQSQPQFTDPWTSASPSHGAAPLFPVSLAPMASDGAQKQLPTSNSVSMPYSSIPVSAPSISAGTSLPMPYGQQDLLSLSQEMMNANRIQAPSYEQRYSTAPSPTQHAYAPTSAPFNDAMAYAQQQQQQQQQSSNERRLSQPSLPSNNFLGSPIQAERQRQNSLVDLNRGLAQLPQQRESFGDALDAGRGMVAMSQDITPRNIYGPRAGRDSNEGYGFPTTHSSSSSISSSSTYPSYYGSVDSSVSDYSSNSDSLDLPSRTLPPPQGLLGGSMPPNPQAMMSQFSSKVSSSTQKKHKCKICDKRFTRPSSLQTHMYSHTGEKPFLCDVYGCGRHFSVVSNLRRHRKVHKGGDRGSISPREDY